jgi:hypothetical protein
MEELNPEKESPQKKVTFLAAVAFCLFAIGVGQAQTQGSTAYSGTGSDSTSTSSVSIQVTPSSQSPYSGSVAQGTVKPEAVSLTFQDAIELALKNNLGVLLQSYNTITARGQKWKELSALLPNVTGAVNVNAVQDNLAARGLRFPGFPTVIGPYGFTDARVYLTQAILNLKALNRERGARED